MEPVTHKYSGARPRFFLLERTYILEYVIRRTLCPSVLVLAFCGQSLSHTTDNERLFEHNFLMHRRLIASRPSIPHYLPHQSIYSLPMSLTFSNYVCASSPIVLAAWFPYSKSTFQHYCCGVEKHCRSPLCCVREGWLRDIDAGV